MKSFSMISMVIIGFLLLTASPLWAHEKRDVLDTQWVVGFVNEPAFAGFLNGIDLMIKDLEGNPVEGLEGELKGSVTRPGEKESLELAFERRYAQPGRYAAYFVPAEAGDYVFHISGMVSGQPVDETFESGPGRFGAVRVPLTFPK